MKRRHWLRGACAHCAAGLGLFAGAAQAQRIGSPESWAAPARFTKPDLATDEGGLWAMMDREETRLRRSPFVMRDAALRQYLQDIACKLAGGHCPDVRVYPVRTPFFNASMAPNGMMQVWSGLLLRVENEAQLAAVIGHELGHYLQRHTLERMRDLKDKAALGAFVGMFGLVGAIGQLALLASVYGFSRDQEREADVIGLNLMRRAGYDIAEAGKVWDNLRSEMAAAHGGDPSKHSPMFATHPQSDERSATLARLAEGGGGGFVGASEYASRLQAFQFDLLDDEVKRGQYGETLVLLERLVNGAPQRADYRYFRAETRRLRAASGDIELALQDLQAAVQIGQEPAQTHRCMGYILQKQNQATQARSAFATYLERAPDAPDAGLIRSYITEGEKS